MDKLQTKRPEFEHIRLRRQYKQHGSLIGGMGGCMGVLKGRPYPVPCLGEITEGTCLLKRFKQGNAVDTFFDMCTHQAVSAVTLPEALHCIFNSGC